MISYFDNISIIHDSILGLNFVNTQFRSDREVSDEDGWTILEVAREHGLDIPALCRYSAVEPSGARRLCMVEVHEGAEFRW
jgi:predicted molibdopterin-dependent oxidoreductase YjgC